MVKELIAIAIVVGWMLSAMAQTQAYGKRNTAEVEVQYQTGGNDVGYQHGDWCMDSRVF